MTIGVGGCSHSSHAYGEPWHTFMGQKLGAKIIVSNTSGGGNETNVEKIKYIFDNNPDLDYFVLQLTEPSRFVFSIGDVENKNDELYILESPYGFRDVKFYTAIGGGNDKRLNQLTNVDVKFDRLFLDHIYTSTYNTKYKFLHTLMSIQHLADFYNKKIIFVSWFVDVKEIAKSIDYEQIIEKMTILDGYVEDFIKKNGIPRLPKNGHYGTNSHDIIFNEYIYPQLKKLIPNKII